MSTTNDHTLATVLTRQGDYHSNCSCGKWERRGFRRAVKAHASWERHVRESA